MGSRDRPHREVKKKPKDKSAPKLQPLSEPPMQVELIRKERKPRRVADEEPEAGDS